MVKTFEQEHISDSMHPEVRRVVAKLQEVLSCLSLMLGQIVAEFSSLKSCKIRNLKGCLFDFSSWGLGRSGGSLLFMEESIPFPP